MEMTVQLATTMDHKFIWLCVCVRERERERERVEKCTFSVTERVWGPFQINYIIIAIKYAEHWRDATAEPKE